MTLSEQADHLGEVFEVTETLTRMQKNVTKLI